MLLKYLTKNFHLIWQSSLFLFIIIWIENRQALADPNLQIVALPLILFAYPVLKLYFFLFKTALFLLFSLTDKAMPNSGVLLKHIYSLGENKIHSINQKIFGLN